MNPLKNNKQGTGIRKSQTGKKTKEKLGERKKVEKAGKCGKMWSEVKRLAGIAV